MTRPFLRTPARSLRDVERALGPSLRLPNAPHTKTHFCPLCRDWPGPSLLVRDSDTNELTCSGERHSKEEIQAALAALLEIADLIDGGPVMIQKCQDCGSQFRGERWQRLCWSCWHNQRDRQAHDAAYQRGWRDGLAAGRRQAPAIDGPLLTALLKLVHPDHHPAERYELANATTAALLDLRGRLAA